jgi:hypothetical protein
MHFNMHFNRPAFNMHGKLRGKFLRVFGFDREEKRKNADKFWRPVAFLRNGPRAFRSAGPGRLP